MKKIILAVLLVAGTAGYAQTFQLGIKGGINLANYSGSNFKSNTLVGFHVGGLLNFKFGEIFSIQPEALFSSQGAKIDNGGTKRDLKVSYLAIPVMAKLTFGSVYVEAGPQVGFKTGEDASVSSQSTETFAKGLDLAIGAGVGYHSKSGLGIGARYTGGVTKVGDFNSNTTYNPDFRNSVVAISIFYTLFNNKK